MGKQIGGWNISTFNNFKEKAIQENDMLKQTEYWWDELKEELEWMANGMSEEFMGESRFEGMPMDRVQDKLDLINLLGVHIAQTYSRMLLDEYFRNVNKENFIENFNRHTIGLKDIVNIDFVEFIQVLIEFIKSSEYYGEVNAIGYIDPDSIRHEFDVREHRDWTNNGGQRVLARKILQQMPNYSNHYKLYKNGLIDCVKLLEIFLLNAYTGKYNELQNRDMVCEDYFYDSIKNRVEMIELVETFEMQNDLIENPGELNSDQIEVHKNSVREIMNKLLSDTGYDSLDSKEDIKEELYDMYVNKLMDMNIKNLKQSNKHELNRILKGFKRVSQYMLVSMLVYRNNYGFLNELKQHNNDSYIDRDIKDIYKTYEQFQVKLAVFYKKLLIKWIGFETLEEYYNADPDKYKNLNKLDFRFIDIVGCIEKEYEKLKEFLHPRNNGDSDNDTDTDPDSDGEIFEMSKLPKTRHVHLYDEKLGIDRDEDSDDEFERIGNEYLSHIKGVKTRDEGDYKYWNEQDYLDAMGSISKILNAGSIRVDYLMNIGKTISIDHGNGMRGLNNLIIDVIKNENETFYRIAIGGIKVEGLGPAILNDEDGYAYDIHYKMAKRNWAGWFEVVDINVNDKDLYLNTIAPYDIYVGDDVYFTDIENYQLEGDTRVKKHVFIYMGDVLTVIPATRGSPKSVEIEHSDSDITRILDVNKINLFKKGLLANIHREIYLAYNNWYDRKEYLKDTYNEFKNLNRSGDSTYHLEYSKDKRGNQNLYPILEERGLGGHEYMKDSISKMSHYAPDKKINIKELRNLRGTGLDLPQHKKNIWPERIGYLEAIMEDDKELKSNKESSIKPVEVEQMEEIYDINGQNKRERDLLQKRRTGTARTLQKSWYKKNSDARRGPRLRDGTPLPEFGSENLLEDNPVFKDDDLVNFLKKSLRKRYGHRSRANHPSQRLNLNSQLRGLDEREGRERSDRIDRMRNERDIRTRTDRDRFDEERLQQSRLIDGRTPVEVMDLENSLRYRQNYSFAQGDNLRRRIDRIQSGL